MSAQSKFTTARIAVITTTLAWEHRTITSGDRFDLDVARRYIDEHVGRSLRLMQEAAALGADLVLGPEYFAGSELFTTTPAQRRQFVDRANASSTLSRVQAVSGGRHVYLAGAMNLFHDDLLAQTGFLCGRTGELLGLQLKNTSLPNYDDATHEYRIFELDIGKTAIFTCSDCTTYPEDTLTAAKHGVGLILVPGCGFAGANWRAQLLTRGLDLGCVLAYADSGRGAIIDRRGRVVAETCTGNSYIFADVEIPQRPSVSRLRGYVGGN